MQRFQFCKYLSFNNFKKIEISRNILQLSKHTKTTIQKPTKPLEYYEMGPHRSHKLRLTMSVCPNTQSIWDYITNNDEFRQKMDLSVFNTALNRCIELKESNELENLINYIINETSFYPKIEQYKILFKGFAQLKELKLSIKWFSIFLHSYKPNIEIINYLIKTCHRCDDFDRGIKFYNLIDTLKLKPNADTFAEMIQLYSSNNDLDNSLVMINLAKDNDCLRVIHYNCFLNGLSYQQKNDILRMYDENILPLSAILCDNFDEELINLIPKLIDEYYTNMMDIEKIMPNFTTFNIILDMLSYYGKVNECLFYYQQLLKEFQLRPNINIYNCLLAAYCNEIVYKSQKK